LLVKNINFKELLYKAGPKVEAHVLPYVENPEDLLLGGNFTEEMSE